MTTENEPLPLLAIRLALQVFRVCYEDESKGKGNCVGGEAAGEVVMPILPWILSKRFSPLPADWRVERVLHAQPYVGQKMASGCIFDFQSQPTFHAVVFRGTIHAKEMPHNLHPKMVPVPFPAPACSSNELKKGDMSAGESVSAEECAEERAEEAADDQCHETRNDTNSRSPHQPTQHDTKEHTGTIPGLVHQGYVDLFASVEGQVLAFLESLSTETTHDILCCGHSLGGAMALLAAVSSLRFSHVRCHLVTFGAGRIVTAPAATWLEAHLATSMAYERESDPVPRVIGRGGGGVWVGTRVLLPAYGWPWWVYPLAHDMIHYHHAIAHSLRRPFRPEITWSGPAWLTRFISPPESFP
eukprot:m.239713 g.239713  ORF g.239713 m.239713 type:complete len:357 (+) comp22778_c0_seq1:206-1276(+)